MRLTTLAQALEGPAATGALAEWPAAEATEALEQVGTRAPEAWEAASTMAAATAGGTRWKRATMATPRQATDALPTA